jgi:SnoaL-like domain
MKLATITQADDLVFRFKQLYEQLDHSNCHTDIIDSVYSENIVFKDSFHEIEGLQSFKKYCSSLYENLNFCEFEFIDEWVAQNTAMLTWVMRYSHPKLKGGKVIRVLGATELRFSSKVDFHQDYFDGGNLLYEHVPLLGMVISQLKKRMSR